MRAQYPKFLSQKPLILGLRIVDLYLVAFLASLLSLANISQFYTLLTIGCYSVCVFILRRNFPRNHFYFLVKNLSSSKWLHITKSMKERE
jgi:hypothetical protein